MVQFPVLAPALQLGFYERLEEAQQRYLLPALLDLVATLNIVRLDQELAALVQLSGSESLVKY